MSSTIVGKKFKREKEYYYTKEDAREAASKWRRKGYYVRVLKRQKDCELIFTIYVIKR